jgi:hypothetical protein
MTALAWHRSARDVIGRNFHESGRRHVHEAQARTVTNGATGVDPLVAHGENAEVSLIGMTLAAGL